jgi:FkbM family methyltransferase
MLRRLLEWASRSVVLKRRLPAEFGRAVVYVSPGSALNFWRFDLGRVDPMLFRIAREHVGPGDVVWDVGANVGLFSFAAASLAGPSGSVLAIEADTWLVGLLRRSSSARGEGEAPVAVIPAAAADAVGVASFKIARRGRASNYLASSPGSNQAGGVREIQLVPTVTLDSLLDLFPPPRLVKIDVEGAEDKVLQGAGRLLSEIRPALACEIFKESRVTVDPLLKELGYTMLDAELPPGERKPLGASVTNTLAYPPGWAS